MQLQRLDLSDFKCFTEQQLRLAKITLLLGANSSGKSSLVQGILAALQTDMFPIALSANGQFVDLGNFQSISHDRELGADVGISLVFTDDLSEYSISGVFKRGGRTGMPTLGSAVMSDGKFSATISRPVHYNVTWRYAGPRDRLDEMHESDVIKKFYAGLGAVFEGFAAPETREKSGSPSMRFSEFLSREPHTKGRFVLTSRDQFDNPALKLANVTLVTRWNRLSGAVRQFRKGFSYVGAFRLGPQRSYYQVSKGDLKVSPDGKNTVEQISEWHEQKQPQLSQLNRALRKLGLLSSVKTAPLHGGLFEVAVRPTRSRINVALPDVGYGISQLLPVLVADLQLPKGGTLAVSQPEIHLHPSAQAKFADHIVDRAIGDDMRYIIETHSEYFINRLRLQVARGRLRTEDISILYLEKQGDAPKSYDILLLPNGTITGAPRSFFDTYMMDVMSIAMEAK